MQLKIPRGRLNAWPIELGNLLCTAWLLLPVSVTVQSLGIDDDFMFQQDNANCHTARYTKEYGCKSENYAS